MTLIEIALGLAALYCGGVWLLNFILFAAGRLKPSTELGAHTFHLGLCFILAAGFLGLLLK